MRPPSRLGAPPPSRPGRCKMRAHLSRAYDPPNPSRHTGTSTPGRSRARVRTWWLVQHLTFARKGFWQQSGAPRAHARAITIDDGSAIQVRLWDGAARIQSMLIAIASTMAATWSSSIISLAAMRLWGAQPTNQRKRAEISRFPKTRRSTQRAIKHLVELAIASHQGHNAIEESAPTATTGNTRRTWFFLFRTFLWAFFFSSIEAILGNSRHAQQQNHKTTKPGNLITTKQTNHATTRLTPSAPPTAVTNATRHVQAREHHHSPASYALGRNACGLTLWPVGPL